MLVHTTTKNRAPFESRYVIREYFVRGVLLLASVFIWFSHFDEYSLSVY